MVGLSSGEKNFIRGGIAQNLRADGRRRMDFRPISIETGVIDQTHGSARVRLGGTEVIVSIKAELGKPAPLQPDKGNVSIFVDCSPTAAPVFEDLKLQEMIATGTERGVYHMDDASSPVAAAVSSVSFIQ